METQIACPSCGAHNPEGAKWCSQCYSSLTPTGEGSEDRRSELAGDEERRFARSTQTGARHPVYSRWRSSETSLGLVGRILATLAVLGVGILIYLFAFTIIPVVLWVVVAVPVLLGAIWKRTLVGYE